MPLREVLDVTGSITEGLAAALSHNWDRAAISEWGKDYDWTAVGRATGQFLAARLAGGGLV